MSFLALSVLADDEVAQSADDSGQHTVSRASILGEPRSRERMDRPAGYLVPTLDHGRAGDAFTPRLDVLPIPFAEFYAAVFGGVR